MPSKSSAGGPMAAVKHQQDQPGLPQELELPTVLKNERTRYEENTVGIQTVDDAARMWFSVYHSLVWLGAVTNLQTEEETLTGNFAGFKIKNHHHVSAFDETQEGVVLWFYGKMQDKFAEIAGTGDKVRGKRFPVSVLQITDAHGSEQPLIKQFLDKIEVQRLTPGTFDLAGMLEVCRASTSEMSQANGYHHRTRDYALIALNTLEPLLTPVREHLEVIHSWLTPMGGSEAWLSDKLQINSLIELGAAKYEDLANDKKLAIGRSSLILEEISFKTFSLIYGRLQGYDPTDSIDGLEKVINKATIDLPGSARSAWLDLLSATYASIAWHIFQQAKTAVTEVRSILQGA